MKNFPLLPRLGLIIKVFHGVYSVIIKLYVMLKIASFLTALFNLIGMKKGKQVYIRASNFDFSPEICTLSIPGIKHCSRHYPAAPFEWKSCTSPHPCTSKVGISQL